MLKKTEPFRLASSRSCIAVVAVLGLALILLATGCDQSGSSSGSSSGPRNEGTPANPVTLTVGVTHSGTVGSYGTSFYRFTTTIEGSYTIALTEMRSDLSWDLYGPAPDYVWMMECDDYYHAADEIATTPVLLASTTYHLTVDEWDYVAGRFKLLITAP